MHVILINVVIMRVKETLTGKNVQGLGCEFRVLALHASNFGSFYLQYDICYLKHHKD